MNLGEFAISEIPVITALLVSPFESDHVVLRDLFSHSSWKLLDAYDIESALPIMNREAVPVIICEQTLRDGDWRLILDAASTMRDPSRVIVCSRLADERLWAEVLHLGGYAVLSTPFRARDAFRPIFLAWHSWNRDRKARLSVARKGPKPEPVYQVKAAAVDVG